MERILIIEDELPMRTALADVLQAEGYRVLSAADGQSGLQRALVEKPDLILLDVMMPKLDGYAVCEELRRLSNSVPILMLTAKGQVEDRVTGLDAGADDYLVKPFATEELLARVRALLRRGKTPDEVLAFGDLTLDASTRAAHRAGRALTLSERESDLLALLLRHALRVVSREQAILEIWQGDASANVVDRYVSNLRRKLGEPPLIETVR